MAAFEETIARQEESKAAEPIASPACLAHGRCTRTRAGGAGSGPYPVIGDPVIGAPSGRTKDRLAFVDSCQRDLP